jgi:hypothetical protein
MQLLKVIVAGMRTFNDDKALNAILMHNHSHRFKFAELIHGGARGADALAMLWAESNQVPVKCFPADWDLHGKSAGYIRNKQMAEYGEVLIAFWDGKSKGTRLMIDLAHKARIHVIVVGCDHYGVVGYK